MVEKELTHGRGAANETTSEPLSEAPRRGAHLAEHAHKGGKAVVAKYGRDYMSQIGGRGAEAVTRKYGLRFYSEIAARNKGIKKRKPAG